MATHLQNSEPYALLLHALAPDVVTKEVVRSLLAHPDLNDR